MAEVVSSLMQEITPAKSLPHNKITIVGVGQVGMACAYSILQQVNFFKLLNYKFVI